jgi:eukaryotic-like serine/threonine-protein kinase
MGATGEMPAPPWGQRQPGPGPLAGVKRAGAGLIGRVRHWPMAIRLAAAGGLAVLLIVAAFALLRDGNDPAAPPPTAGSQPTTAPAASFQTQTEDARGLTVNVPADWQRKASGLWVDFFDPEDANRKVRILVENSSADPAKFMQSASNRLRQNANSNCARPYNQVALTEVEQAGRPAAELEYTCGSGASMRHGVWRAVVTGGKAYSFFLTTPDSRFAESRPVFDEMVRTFEVTAAG